MKRILLTLLAVAVVIGLFAATGYAGYRLGYVQGARGTANADSSGLTLRPFRLFDDAGPRGMDNFGPDRGFSRDVGPGGFPMRGFGLFSPLRLLVQLAVIALIIGFVYWLFTRSVWRLTRTVQSTEAPPQPTEPDVKE